MLGNHGDEGNEIVIVTGMNGGQYTIARGMLDTTPKFWPSGTPIWVLSSGVSTADPQRRSAFEDVDYHFQTITSQGKLPIADTPMQSITLTERPHLPNRPADVQVDGVGFGTVTLSTETSVTVTWANRNRTTEASQTPRWDEVSASPEPGQTTKISILKTSDRTEINTMPGLTGTSATVQVADFNGETGCADPRHSGA